MNCGRDHATHNRGCDGLHHVGADTRFPQYRSEAENDCRHGHQFWTESLHRTVDRSLLDVAFRQWPPLS